MQFLIAAFVGGLGMAAGSIVGRILVALGVTYVTYNGISILSDWLYSSMVLYMGQLPVEVVNFFGFLWVDKAVAMIFAAWTAALALKIGAGSSITKMQFKA